MGRGPAAVVKAACLESRRSRVRTPLWHSSFKETKMFLLRSLVEVIYCGEPPWLRGSVLGLRPPWLEFRIICLEGMRCHLIHHTIPGRLSWPVYAQKWPPSNQSFMDSIICLVLHSTRIIKWLYERVITSHARHVNTRFVIWLHLEMWITAVIPISRSRWKKSSWWTRTNCIETKSLGASLTPEHRWSP